MLLAVAMSNVSKIPLLKREDVEFGKDLTVDDTGESLGPNLSPCVTTLLRRNAEKEDILLLHI